jgi:hypothetical protein
MKVRVSSCMSHRIRYVSLEQRLNKVDRSPCGAKSGEIGGRRVGPAEGGHLGEKPRSIVNSLWSRRTEMVRRTLGLDQLAPVPMFSSLNSHCKKRRDSPIIPKVLQTPASAYYPSQG